MGSLATSGATVSKLAEVSTGRIPSIDFLRGAVMVVMAIDHTRDFFTNLTFEPESLSQTWTALFFTRWITHFCAPLFFFLAGTGAFYYGMRRAPSALSRYLVTRGLWLIAVEFTIVGTAWTFKAPWGFFGVIWCLGASMCWRHWCDFRFGGLQVYLRRSFFFTTSPTPTAPERAIGRGYGAFSTSKAE